MTVLVATVGAYVCCLTLLISGLAHARRVGEFEVVLRRQRLVPASLVQVGARSVVTLELALGGIGLLALGVVQSEAAARPVLLAAAMLFTAYALYSAYLVAQGRSVPCGCSTADYPVNAAVVARAAGLSIAALSAAVGAGRIIVPAGDAKFAIAAAASIGLTAILWALPAALHDPAAAQAPVPVSTFKALGGRR